MAGNKVWAPRRLETTVPSEVEARFASRIARTRKHLRLPTEKLTKWEIWCTVNRVDFQDLVEEAIDYYLFMCVTEAQKLDAQAPTIRSDDLDRSMISEAASSESSSGRLGAQPLDLDDEKEKHILGYYAAATGNRLKQEDKTVYKERFANLAPHLSKLVILNAVLRCKGKPNSLKYCATLIDEFVDLAPPEKYLDFMVESILKSPLHHEYLGPERMDNLRRAFAIQPTLPGFGADIAPFEKGAADGTAD